MPHVISRNSATLNSILNLLIIVCLIVIGFTYFNSDKRSNITTPKSSFTERELAIAEAIKAGKKTYEYHSSFIPGIGVVDADNIRKQFNRIK